MKRSEAIKALVKFVYEASDGQAELFDEEASLVLKWLEELGMRPPAITVLPDSYNRTEGTYGFEVNEWDKEE